MVEKMFYTKKEDNNNGILKPFQGKGDNDDAVIKRSTSTKMSKHAHMAELTGGKKVFTEDEKGKPGEHVKKSSHLNLVV